MCERSRGRVLTAAQAAFLERLPAGVLSERGELPSCDDRLLAQWGYIESYFAMTFADLGRRAHNVYVGSTRRGRKALAKARLADD